MGAFGITLVSLTDTISTASSFAGRTGDQVRGNQEMIGIGAANIASSFFQGFPVSSSSSRTPVAESSGARTQLTGVVAGVAMSLIALAVPGVFRHMPEAPLAAIVMAAAITLIDIPALVYLYRVRRSEFVLAMSAMLAVALLGPVTGAVVAVGLSVLNFLRLAWKPYTGSMIGGR